MKLRLVAHMSALVLGLGLVVASKADADMATMQVVNQTPFNFTGSIVRFPASRERFAIVGTQAGESYTQHNYEGSFFAPSFLLETATRNKELCYFGGIDDNLVVTISYNHCDASQPNCVITCVGAPEDPTDATFTDSVTVSYDRLAAE